MKLNELTAHYNGKNCKLTQTMLKQVKINIY